MPSTIAVPAKMRAVLRLASSPYRLDTALVQDLVFFRREIGARQRARNGGWIFDHGSFLRMCDGALDMGRPGVRPMIDPIGFWRLIIDAQHLAASPKAQLTCHQMDDDEFVADVKGDQRFRPVRSHQINGRHLTVRGEAQHRELTVVGDLRRLKLAGAPPCSSCCEALDDRMIEGAANGPALQGRCLHGNLCSPETLGAVGVVRDTGTLLENRLGRCGP
jgi:hypothetical protein